MKLVMITCEKYSDAWNAFFFFLKTFWPDHPLVYVITDEVPADSDISIHTALYTYGKAETWCGMLSQFAQTFGGEPMLLMQEDHWLTDNVRTDLIEHGLNLMKSASAGMVRLYPCPGANKDIGDPYFGEVTVGTNYRISCQVSIWRPDYLFKIASQYAMPQAFELMGSPYSATLPDVVLAWKRDVEPWPMPMLVTGIVNGAWTQGAKEHAAKYGVVVDWSRRPSLA